MDWDQKTTEHETVVADFMSEKNTTFDYVKPTWDLFKHVDTKVTHKYKDDLGFP